MRAKDVAKMVQVALDKQEQVLSSLCTSDNPQVKATAAETLGRCRAYAAVLEAIRAPRPRAAFSLFVDGGNVLPEGLQ